jgi:hypothetical protein
MRQKTGLNGFKSSGLQTLNVIRGIPYLNQKFSGTAAK